MTETAPRAGRAAVFLDRDGTLIEERSYPTRPADIVVLPAAGEALRRLETLGLLRIVLTNQSAVARGMIDEIGLERLHEDMLEKLRTVGGGVEALYYCPHHPEGTAAGYAWACRCRKPAPGLVDLAVARHGIDLSRSCFVGDSVRDLFPDLEGVGLRLLVRTGHPIDDVGPADAVVDDLHQALDRITEWIASRPCEDEPPSDAPLRERGA